ncbi:PREDICTED: patellin-4-like [Ipomoea nil]|uniref:patellin-4-like n=1 Tax=Ipomoea nil TaxID=35883 RepID=UPI00090085E2|nr:PREDICTED: patellin-4-like [Ipomoea nil]
MPEQNVSPSLDVDDEEEDNRSIIINDEADQEFLSEPIHFGPESQDDDEDDDDGEEMKLSAKMALLDFRGRIEDAILSNYLVYNKKKNDTEKVIFSKRNLENQRDMTLWGVPLLSSKGHQGTDVVLMSFLKARDYKVAEAFKALRKVLRWRTKHRVDGILDEEFSPEVENMWFTNGKDRKGRPICYQVLGNFKKKDLQREIWGTHNQHRKELVRWRIQCLEKGIRLLDFKPGAQHSLVLVTDLRNSPGTAMKEVRWITRKMLRIVQDNYPGLIYKNIVINVPIWYSTFHAFNLRVIQQRSKTKFIFVKPARVTDTLLRYIPAEQLQVHYGGIKRDIDDEFSPEDKVLEETLKPSIISTIKIPANQVDMTITWDWMVVGNEVMYKEEFVPEDDCSYNVLLQSDKKLTGLVRNSFHIREPGEIAITIHNLTSKKKRAFYRSKTKPSVYQFTRSTSDPIPS